MVSLVIVFAVFQIVTIDRVFNTLKKFIITSVYTMIKNCFASISKYCCKRLKCNRTYKMFYVLLMIIIIIKLAT